MWFGCNLSRYYPEYVTVNRGVCGDTTFGPEKRLKVSVYDPIPKVAVILIGGNNLGTMLENYGGMIIGIEENRLGTDIVICPLTSMGMDWEHKDHIEAYNSVFLKKLAMKHDCAFVDLYMPPFDENTGRIHAEYTMDGEYLTHEGYLVLTGAVKESLSGSIHH